MVGQKEPRSLKKYLKVLQENLSPKAFDSLCGSREVSVLGSREVEPACISLYLLLAMHCRVFHINFSRLLPGSGNTVPGSSSKQHYLL